MFRPHRSCCYVGIVEFLGSQCGNKKRRALQGQTEQGKRAMRQERKTERIEVETEEERNWENTSCQNQRHRQKMMPQELIQVSLDLKLGNKTREPSSQLKEKIKRNRYGEAVTLFGIKILEIVSIFKNIEKENYRSPTKFQISKPLPN